MKEETVHKYMANNSAGALFWAVFTIIITSELELNIFIGDILVIPIGMYLMLYHIFNRLPKTTLSFKFLKTILYASFAVIFITLAFAAYGYITSNYHSVCIDGAQTKYEIECYEYERQEGRDYGSFTVVLFLIYLTWFYTKTIHSEIANITKK